MTREKGVTVSVPVVTIVGAQILTRRAAKLAGAPSLAGTVRLFTSNTTPTGSSVASDFTEATFAGYARRAVANDSFDPVTVVSGVSVAPNTANPFLWTPGSDQDVHGWLYVLDSGELLSAEKFDAALEFVAGSTFQLALSLTGQPV